MCVHIYSTHGIYRRTTIIYMFLRLYVTTGYTTLLHKEVPGISSHPYRAYRCVLKDTSTQIKNEYVECTAYT